MLKPTKTFFPIIFLSIFFLLSVSTFVILAQEISDTTDSEQDIALDETVEAENLEVSEPTLLPDSPLYFLKNWGRAIRNFFAFSRINKANLRLKFSAEKLLEVRKLVQKTKDPEILKQALENYKEEIDKIKETTEKIKEKASEDEETGKFLDKFIKQEVLHQKILEKLENQVPEEVAQKIRKKREEHIRRFGEVMEKLENGDQEKIKERLEKNLEEMKGSKFKDFKNLEVLEKLEEKLPEKAKEAIKEVRENILSRLGERLEKMPTSSQERFRNYVEKIQGNEEIKMRILQNLELRLEEKPELEQKLNQAREKILQKIQERKPQTGLETFCGISTYGTCSTVSTGTCVTDADGTCVIDISSDCIVGGCSNEVCQSKKDEPFATACIWKNCYKAEEYKMECKCLNNQCQWSNE